MITISTNQVTIDAENLDCLNESELAFTQESLKLLQKQLQQVINYAEAKQNAIICRKQGKIQSAICFEDCCELVNLSLPSWAKW